MDLMYLVPDLESHDEMNQRQPNLTHDCKTVEEKDEVDKFIVGDDVWKRFSRWYTRMRIVTINHFYAQSCLKSKTAVRHEISKHLKKYPYMIHPFSRLKVGWDGTMAVLTLLILIATPFYNSFYWGNEGSSTEPDTNLKSIAMRSMFKTVSNIFDPRSSDDDLEPMSDELDDKVHKIILLLILDFLIDSTMMCDVLVQFATGHFDQKTKTVTMDPKFVCKKYCKGYFFFDFLSAMPFEVVDYVFGSDDNVEWYSSIFNFLKIFRMRNLLDFISQLPKMYYISFQKVKTLELMIVVSMYIHWSGCIIYYVSDVIHREIRRGYEIPEKSWILTEHMLRRNNSVLKMYVLSLNRATISIVSATHFLEVEAPEDMVVNVIYAIFGKIGFIYLLAQFLQLTATIHSSSKERLRQLQQLEEYMQYKELPSETQKRLWIYCDYWYKKNFTRDKLILAQVSEPLREELIFNNYRTLLKTVDLFKLLPQRAIIQLVNFIKPQIFLTSDVIVKSGDPGDSMYFIGSGSVAVYTSLGREVCHLEDGAYFGEIALIMENEHRVATVIAIETCEILVVPREAFQQIIAPYPNLLSRLQKVALERIEKTLLLDELYGVEDIHPHYINVSNIRGKRLRRD